MTRTKLLNQIFIIMAVCLFLFFPSTAFAATYYIDYVSGSDANKGTSTSTPWKRCPGMARFAGSYSHSAGDKFVFKGGVTWPAAVLPLTIGYSGTEGNIDIYVGGQRESTPWGTDYPVFDGENTGAFQSGAVYQSGKNYITIDGIKIVRVGDTKDGSGQALLFDGGSGITVKNCWLQPNGVNAFAYGTSSGNYSAVYFHDNIIKQAGRIHVSVGDATCDDFQFYNNTMYGGYDYDSHSYHTDGFMIGADGVGSWKATNLKIYNNKFLGDWRKSGTAQIFLSGSPNHYGWQHILIYNNLTVTENTIGDALSPGMISLWYGQDDVKIYNNTIDARSNPSPPSHCISFFGVNSNIDIKNNILAGCDNGITMDSLTTGIVTIDYNLYYTTGSNHLIWDARTSVNTRCNTLSDCRGTPVSQEAHGIMGEPKFVALPSGGVVRSGDWRLQNDSPAVNKGTNLSAFFTKDFLGNTRSGKWDIGAYKRRN